PPGREDYGRPDVQPEYRAGTIPWRLELHDSSQTTLPQMNQLFLNEPYPVELKVGEVMIISKSFDIVTPVITPLCDDLKVVDVVDTPDGPAFKGIAPGKTLCSVRAGV